MRHLRLFMGLFALMMTTAIYAAVGSTFKIGIVSYKVLTEDAANATGTVSFAVANSSATELTIPATVTNNDIVYTVTEVGYCNGNKNLKKVIFDENSAVTKITGHFMNCSNLEEINLPATLISLGTNCFNKCTSLKEIQLPASLKTINSAAFRETGITEVNIPASVTSLNSTAFYGCPVTSMTVDPKNKKYKSVGNCILSKDGKTLVTGGSNPVIPDGVVTISNSAFAYRPGVTSITIPETCTTIGDYAFLGTEISSLYIPQSVTTTGSSPFNGTHITSVHVDDLATFLKINTANAAFISNPDTLWTLYVNNERIEELVVPEEITKLGPSILACSDIKKITCTNVKEIGWHTFERCENLETVVLPETMTEWGYYCFGECVKLKNITIPGGMTEIPLGAFQKCYSLETINIPDNIININDGAFQESGIKNISMGSNVNKIAERAFNNCDNLVEITLPNSLTSLGKCAFKGCDNLVTVNNETFGLTSIEIQTFMDCPKLEFITLNAGIKTMGMDIFDNDSTLRSIKIPNSVETIDPSGAFSNCKSLSHLTLPSHLTNKIGYMANGSKCSEITIPAYANGGTNMVLEPLRNPEKDYSIFYMGDELQAPYSNYNKDGIKLYAKRSVIEEKYPKGIPVRFYNPQIWAYDTTYWALSSKIPLSMTNASGSPIEYKTLCRDFDVDLTHTNDNLPEGVEPLRAYVVEDVDGDLRMVFMNEIKYIPSRLKANVTDENGNLYQGVDEYVGVLLRGTPGYTYYYEMGEHDYTQGASGQWLLDDAMAYSGKLFEGNLMAGDANDDFYVFKTALDENDDEIINYGLNNGRFKIYNKNGWLTYNKSYLQLPKHVSEAIEGAEDAEGNVNLTFMFNNSDGSTDKISSVEFMKNAESDIFYNPYGQRVSKDTKGIVINNGKKFVNK